MPESIDAIKNDIKNAINWVKGQPKWKKYLFGIFWAILLIGVVIITIASRFAGSELNLIPKKGEEPIKGKKNSEETDVPNPKLVKPIKTKFEEMRKDMAKKD